MGSLMPRLFFCTRRERLVNGLFNFCFNCHHCGAPVNLLHVSDVMYCNKWQLKKTRWLKHYQKTKLGKTKEQTSKGMPGLLWTCGACSELANWQWEFPDLQLNVDKIVLGSLWGWQRFQVLWIFVSWRSEVLRKIIPTTSCLFAALS